MLTEEQQRRLEDLKSQKSYLVNTRSEYRDRKSRISDILNDVEVYWNNNIINDQTSSVNDDRLIKEVDLRSSINNTQSSNWASKLNNNVDEMIKWLEDEYGSIGSAIYSRWVEAANNKISINDRLSSMLEILDELNNYYINGNSGALT